MSTQREGREEDGREKKGLGRNPTPFLTLRRHKQCLPNPSQLKGKAMSVSKKKDVR